LFSQLLDVVKMDVTRVLMTVRIQSQDQVAEAALALQQEVAAAADLANASYTQPSGDGSVTTQSAAAVPRSVSLPAGEVPKVGRNEPCPCGSGKKYKNCHGQLA
jgi:preprotein translocase subunit SecA